MHPRDSGAEAQDRNPLAMAGFGRAVSISWLISCVMGNIGLFGRLMVQQFAPWGYMLLSFSSSFWTHFVRLHVLL